MPQKKRVSRRKFLRIAGASAAVIGGVAIGLSSLEDIVRKNQSNGKTTSQTTTPPKKNSPPYISNFEIRPKYINPTDATDIQFSEESHDSDNDPLTVTWTIDGKVVSNEPTYTTRLSQGLHIYGLQVSDGTANAVNSVISMPLTVEPDQLSDSAYQPKPLYVKYKGMRYSPGFTAPVSVDKMDEQLTTIHYELGCNAIVLNAWTDYEDNLITAGKIAIQKGFEKIYISPVYKNVPVDDTIQKIASFASRVKTLRESSESIVFMVGHEFGLDMFGIIPGDTWEERLQYQFQHSDWQALVAAKLPSIFAQIIAICKQKYRYEIAYAAADWEVDLVPWSDPIFESVGVNEYIRAYRPANKVSATLLNLQNKHRKPVNSTEWGCLSVTGSGSSAEVDLNPNRYPYDEEEQVKYILSYCNMLNSTKINGAFWTQYNDERQKGYGLYNGLQRKKGFYMFKSFIIA